jgi:hypothetical protein
MKKRIIHLSAAIIAMIAMTTLTVAPAAAQTGAGVKFEMADEGGGVYKLVFQAKTPTTIQLFGLVFSYDKSVVQPVAAYDHAIAVDVPYLSNPLNYDDAAPFNMLLEAVSPPPTNLLFAFAPTSWGETAGRAAFSMGLYHGSATRLAESNGAYVGLFEFYFKLQSGKTVSDIKSATFKFEKASDPANLFSLFFPVGTGYGIILDEISGTSSYYFGTENTALYPESMDEVINPFADNTPPTPGGAITTANVAMTSLDLNWAKATDNESAQTDLKYYVYQNSSTFTMSNGLPTDGTLLNSGGSLDMATYTVSSLLPGTTYYFIVVVEDEAGNKAAYAEISETTAPDTTPPTPGGSGTITTANVEETSLDLNWAKATDDVSAMADLKYFVYQNSNAFTMSGGLPTDGTLLNSGGSLDIATYTVSSLSPGTTYYFWQLYTN